MCKKLVAYFSARGGDKKAAESLVAVVKDRRLLNGRVNGEELKKWIDNFVK